jgi:hypothetical protein
LNRAYPLPALRQKDWDAGWLLAKRCLLLRLAGEAAAAAEAAAVKAAKVLIPLLHLGVLAAAAANEGDCVVSASSVQIEIAVGDARHVLRRPSRRRWRLSGPALAGEPLCSFSGSNIGCARRRLAWVRQPWMAELAERRMEAAVVRSASQGRSTPV